MTKALPPLKQDYSHHGQTALKNALKQYGKKEEWLESLGDVGQALKDWQCSLIADMGGEDNISAMERSIIELATKTHLLLASVDKYLLEQTSLVNKRRRQLFPVVLQRQQLADALARYMAQLGLQKRAKTLPDLSTYLSNGKEREESKQKIEQ